MRGSTSRPLNFNLNMEFCQYSSGESDAEEKPKKEQCHNCANEHKYKCPRCFVLSCSLPCINAHKQAQSCSGKPDPISKQKLSMAQMSSQTLRRDLSFLETCIDLSNRAKKDNHITSKLEVDQ